MPVANLLENSYTDITTDNSWQTVFDEEVPEDRAFIFEMQAAAVRYDTGDTAIWSTSGRGIREGNGNVSLEATVDLFSPSKSLGASLWDMRAVADGTHVKVQIKGAASNDVHWRVAGQVIGINQS